MVQRMPDELSGSVGGSAYGIPLVPADEWKAGRGGLLQVQVLEIRGELRTELRIGQRKLHGCSEVVQLVPGVVAGPGELIGVHGALRHQGRQRIGQIDLPSQASGRLLQHWKDLGCEDEAPDLSEVGRGLLSSRLLDHREGAIEALLYRFDRQHPVLVEVLARDT